jgi:preprotein translocase subunit SecG
MTTVLLVIHLLIALSLVGVVLLQRSEGGGLGIGGGGGGGGGMSGFMTGRGTANLLTRTTAILAASFMASSLLLTILAGGGEERAGSIVDQLPSSLSTDPLIDQPVEPATGESEPSGPSVPLQ